MSVPAPKRQVPPIRPGTAGTLAVDSETLVPVNFLETGDEILLALLGEAGDTLDRPVSGLVLESCTSRGLVRMRGTALRLDDDLVRFRVSGRPYIVQRRQFVRVIAPQRVELDDACGSVTRTHSLNISGGGMLITGAAALGVGTDVRFSVSLGEDVDPIGGLGRVVRAASDPQRAIVFEEIAPADRERLIRFIFDRQRAALAVTRGDTV
jgi:hypothetical protein